MSLRLKIMWEAHTTAICLEGVDAVHHLTIRNE